MTRFVFAVFVVADALFGSQGTPVIPVPTAGFTVSVPVSLAQAIDIHSALLADLGPVVPASVQAAVQQRVTDYLQDLARRGRQADSRSVEEKYRQLSPANQAAVKAQIDKLLKQ